MPLYLLLDPARDRAIAERLPALTQAYKAIETGLSPTLAQIVGPHVVYLEPGSEALAWFLADGVGHSWGTLWQTQAGAAVAFDYWSKLFIRMENGREVYFRFYDPRVAVRFMAREAGTRGAANYFGPMEAVVAETDTPDLWHLYGAKAPGNMPQRLHAEDLRVWIAAQASPLIGADKAFFEAAAQQRLDREQPPTQPTATAQPAVKKKAWYQI